MPKQIGKNVFYVSKYYLVNPWKKRVKPKAYDNSREASYSGKSKILIHTYIPVKGDRVINLIRYKNFKVVK